MLPSHRGAGVRKKNEFLFISWEICSAMCFDCNLPFEMKSLQLNSSLNPLSHIWIFLMLMIFVGEIGLEFYQSFFPLCNYAYLSLVSETLFRTRKFLVCAMRESYFSNSDHLSTERRLVSFVGILYIVHACKNVCIIKHITRWHIHALKSLKS